jgi:DNA repair protein RadC
MRTSRRREGRVPGSRGDEGVREAVGPRGAISSWPAGERPMEKMLQQGPAGLTDAELLALVIRTGSGGATALDLARGILGPGGTLRSIARRNAQELMRLRGIGEAKAVEILAALEIGRRVQRQGDSDRVFVRSPEDAARILMPGLRDLQHEVFMVLVLDANNGVIAEAELSRGTLNASIVHPREVFKLAIDRLGASVLVAHNHPSGNPEPSREDIEITRQIASAGRIIGIPLHDHLIIAGKRYTSLAERGECT